MTVLVPDISEFQPDVADATLLKWTQAVIIRAAYGDAHDDTAWYGGQRRDLLHSSGARFVGIYQYIVASQSVIAQAHALLSLIGSLRPGERIVGDLEEGDGLQTARWRAWAEVIKSATGQAPWCYSGLNYAQTHGLTPEWVADYPTMAPLDPPAIPAGEPGTPHILWQFSSNYQVPGVPGRCDCSVFHGSIEELAALAYQPGGHAPAPAPKPAPAPAPKPAPVPADWQAQALARLPVLQAGARDTTGTWVRRAQALCDALGDPCGIDGVFGPATGAAVKTFQANHGLTQDGVVGPKTWVMLATAGKPLPVLKQGAKDTREPWMVRRLQGLLNAAGVKVAIDGVFGPATGSAVKTFQSVHVLTSDGVAGPATWSVLIAGKTP